MRDLNDINKDIKRLYKEREDVLIAKHKHMIGSCYKLPNAQLWVKVTQIERNDFITLELDEENGVIMMRKREFGSSIFIGGMEITEKEFDEAFDLISLKLKGGML